MGFYKTSGIESILKEDVMRSLDYLLTPKEIIISSISSPTSFSIPRNTFQSHKELFSLGEVEDGYVYMDISDKLEVCWNLGLLDRLYRIIEENLMISIDREFRMYGEFSSELMKHPFLLSIKYLQWFNKNIKQNDKETI